MESLAPPLVCGNIQTRHCGRIILHLRSLLGESHPVHEVGSPLFRRQAGVEIRQSGRILSDCGLCGQDEGKRSSSHDKSLQHPGQAMFHVQTSGWIWNDYLPAALLLHKNTPWSDQKIHANLT
jgi:hypothetical protein